MSSSSGSCAGAASRSSGRPAGAPASWSRSPQRASERWSRTAAARPDLRPEELEAEWFRCDALHVSGYALMREPVASAALRAGELARAAGAQVSLDLSSWTLIDDAFRERARALAPALVFAVEHERDALGDLTARWIVKRGADGVVVDGEAFPAVPTEVVDATGAGDAFAAGFLVGGVEAGLDAAARCCAKLGAMP